MIPILSIVGCSDSGKTTLIEKLIPALNRRGYRVGTIKHDVHGFEMDQEGKDTWRHTQAGASSVVISSPTKSACIKQVDEEMSLDAIVYTFLADMDLVLTEGYKRQRKPKIEVHREACGEPPICTGDDTLIALATDTSTNLPVPHLDLNDAEAIADFVIQHFSDPCYHDEIHLYIDGKEVPLHKRFSRSILKSTVFGMLHSLSGTEDAKFVKLIIGREEKAPSEDASS